MTYARHRVGDMATADEGFYFAEGTVSSWTFDIPEIVPCDVEATPVTPAPSTAMCGVEAHVVMPTVTGVTYAQVRDGAMVRWWRCRPLRMRDMSLSRRR